MLTRESILQQTALPTEPIEVFGDKAFIKTMTGIERDGFEQAMIDARKRGKINVRASLVVRILCDEKGQRLFTDADADAVGQLSARDLDKVWEAGTRLNGIGAADVKTLEGNLETGPNAGSTLDSPSI